MQSDHSGLIGLIARYFTVLAVLTGTTLLGWKGVIGSDALVVLYSTVLTSIGTATAIRMVNGTKPITVDNLPAIVEALEKRGKA